MPGLEDFERPKALEVVNATSTYAKFVTEPWESGFGHTLGNALRRVLLSSMEGVAVKSVRIGGVAHEFSSIPGVVEDVTEIVLNLKKLHFLCDGDMPRKLELRAETKGAVTAAAIAEDGVARVLNTDLHICTLDEDNPLRMEIEIDHGRGYRPAEENKLEDQPIGSIPVDCLFSPVERVAYDIQACRVGQRTDYDRLEIEVWTDGRIDPQVAMHRSAALLRDHLAIFVSSDGEIQPTVAITSPEDQELVQTLCMSVNELELSVRAKNCLNTAQIRFLGELVEKSEAELLKFRNFGKKSLQEIGNKLEELGLLLGVTLKDEVRSAFEQSVAEQEGEE